MQTSVGILTTPLILLLLLVQVSRVMYFLATTAVILLIVFHTEALPITFTTILWSWHKKQQARHVLPALRGMVHPAYQGQQLLLLQRLHQLPIMEVPQFLGHRPMLLHVRLQVEVVREQQDHLAQALLQQILHIQ